MPFAPCMCSAQRTQMDGFACLETMANSGDLTDLVQPESEYLARIYKVSFVTFSGFSCSRTVWAVIMSRMILISLILSITTVCVALQASGSGEVQSYCHVYHPEDSRCGPKTPTYCETCPNWSACSSSASLTGWNLTDGVREREIYFTEQEYFLYKQLTLDYTIEFMKNPLPGDIPVALPYCGVRAPQSGSSKEKRGWWKEFEHYVQTHGKSLSNSNFSGTIAAWW